MHRYGKRTAKEREAIERSVPAIVPAETWHKAQRTLRKNQRFSRRNAKQQYLLRGLVKCGRRGLTYSGAFYKDVKGNTKTYYTCNGKTQYRGIYGSQGKRCPSKAVPGLLEELVWTDIEGFRQDPGPVIEQLAAQIGSRGDDGHRLATEIADLERALAGFEAQRDAILNLYRRGRIDADALDRQLDQIAEEEKGLRADPDAVRARAAQVGEGTDRLHDAKSLLQELNRCRDEALTWEAKRQIVELLVVSIRVDTVGDPGKEAPAAEITYAFAPAVTRTGIRAYDSCGGSIVRTHRPQRACSRTPLPSSTGSSK